MDKKTKILSPKSDIIFKLIFGTLFSIDILTDFLMAVLKLSPDEYDEVTIANPILLQEYKGDKLGILDVRLKLKSGKTINIEIQIQPVPHMKERIVFYDAKLITDQIGESDNYEKIKRVISIIITDYPLIDESPNYHHRFLLYDPENNVTFTDILEIHTLEIPKIGESDDTRLWNWMKFLDVKTEEELNVLAEKSPIMKKAAVRLMELSADEKARMLYEAREKERRDNYARERGAVKSREIEIAQNAIRKNMSVEDIADITGLTHAEIESLHNADQP